MPSCEATRSRRGPEEVSGVPSHSMVPNCSCSYSTGFLEKNNDLLYRHLKEVSGTPQLWAGRGPGECTPQPQHPNLAASHCIVGCPYYIGCLSSLGVHRLHPVVVTKPKAEHRVGLGKLTEDSGMGRLEVTSMGDHDFPPSPVPTLPLPVPFHGAEVCRLYQVGFVLARWVAGGLAQRGACPDSSGFFPLAPPSSAQLWGVESEASRPG